MSPHELNALRTLHVTGVLVLIGYTFFAFAGASETRKRVLMITGVASLLVLLTGLRLWQGVLAFQVLGWVVIKLLCWLALSAVSGFAYRRRELTNTLMVVTLVLAITAVAMAFVRPF
ncbi:MAG: hypothetical protein HZA93_05640 [Verrucomicrobia bacterium]|nr:hypothetical protein [Verrucomicrobiota bacterium]